jgi:hypothetical protein
MNKARNLVLKLHKKNKITTEEANILLDCMQSTCSNNYSNWGKPDWTYRPAEQPQWTITSTNTDI